MTKLLVGLVVAGALATGCSSPGKIDVDGIADLVSAVSARHDAYVLRDTQIPPEKRDTYLDSSAILRKIVAEASRAKHGEKTP